MKTALVLGGTRFFGKHLVRALLDQGVDVTVATRGQTEDGFGQRVKRLTIDRTDRDSVVQAVEGRTFDFVFDQICYGPTDAQYAVEAFAGKVGRYIFTSTLSVYDLTGEALAEEGFDPYQYPIRYGERSEFDYQEGKRLAEAVFFQKADFPVVAVRIPIVMGTDDYTRRLHFYVERIRDGVPFYIPNLDAKMNFITSQEAGNFLAWVAQSELTGPVNACATGTISIRELLALIEEKVGKQAVLAQERTDATASPYGIPVSWYMDTTRAERAGFAFTRLHDWLPQLVQEIVKE
ncbi:MAG: NAD-dependent epimerase/dehydratase family protein [Tumebacillaceae bacterium]